MSTRYTNSSEIKSETQGPVGRKPYVAISMSSQRPDPRDALKRFSRNALRLGRNKVLNGVIAIGQTTSEVPFPSRFFPSAPPFRSLTLSVCFSLPFSSISLSLPGFIFYLSLYISLYLSLSLLHQAESDRKGQNDYPWLIYPRSIHGEELFESTIDCRRLPSSSFSLSLSVSCSPLFQHPIPVSNGELSRRAVLIPGAIVQLGINPPVVPDCCERSFLLRSYINRLRSAAKRDPTSSLGPSAKVVLFLPPCSLSWQEESLSSVATTCGRQGKPASRDSAESSRSISEWPYISARLPSRPPPLSYFRGRSR